MKDFDVQAEVTYKTWIRVSAEDEFSAQRKVNDMAWDMTAIQYQVMENAESTGEVRDAL
jgi:hypothetical protein|tara:strand:- start:720 stop:896 length:177 start_codon:yes stop_codon:yes gene_type:complete